MEVVMGVIDEREEECLLVGGDCNARTGDEGGPIVTNKEGRILIERIEERGWMILNGTYEEEGGWTYIGETGLSVIDYAIANERAKEEVERVTEGDRTESDHVPVEVELRETEEQEETRSQQKEREKEVEKTDWTEEGIIYYHGKCEGWRSTKEDIEGTWGEIAGKVKSSIKKIRRKIIRWKLGKKDWHSRVWGERKRELKKTMRAWKKGKINREEYIGKRKEFRAWCEEEKRRHALEEEEKIKNIRTEAEAWKYINRYRKRRENINETIEVDRWKKHFMELLGGKEDRVTLNLEGEEGEDTQEEEEIEDITKEDLIKQLRKLKKAKAPGEDGIENEAWIYMPKEIGEEVWKIINKIWREGEIVEESKRGIISPIYKKGEKSEVKNYRGVTLMNTAYKIYASLLNEKLRNEVEEGLYEGQFGFRKGRGTIDAVCTLNCVVNKELGQKGGKIFAFFADLKAAFGKS
ncbi:uncharacterized protein LOC143187781 [Calliopsis andreniformis]|uniref:uncharacterized protein LOC143187781 n=1 Tax=Calliopsis andreniformis TaxID=337506 RepID=UPI003FCD076C